MMGVLCSLNTQPKDTLGVGAAGAASDTCIASCAGRSFLKAAALDFDCHVPVNGDPEERGQSCGTSRKFLGARAPGRQYHVHGLGGGPALEWPDPGGGRSGWEAAQLRRAPAEGLTSSARDGPSGSDSERSTRGMAGACGTPALACQCTALRATRGASTGV